MYRHSSVLKSTTKIACVLCQRLLTYLSLPSYTNMYSLLSSQKRCSKSKSYENYCVDSSLQTLKYRSIFCLFRKSSALFHNYGSILKSRNIQTKRDYKSFLLSSIQNGFLSLNSNHRCVHSHSKFSLHNPLYNSYLLSLLDELTDLESDNSKSDVNDSDHSSRLQFLKSSCGIIHELFGKKKELDELCQMMECKF